MQINKAVFGSLEYEWNKTKGFLNILWVLNRNQGNGDFRRFLEKIKKEPKVRIKWVSYQWLKDYLIKHGFKKERKDDYIWIK